MSQPGRVPKPTELVRR